MKWIKNTFWTGYTTFERMFLYGSILLQLLVYCITPESPISMIAGVAGCASVVMCAKGRWEFYLVGFVQTVTYLYLAWEARFYGEVIENLWYFVTMIWGIWAWKKNMQQNMDGTEQVEAKKFTKKQWAGSAVATIVATVAMGMWLKSIGSAQPFTDAATNVLAIFAQIMMVKRYREQWLWWLVIDVLCIKLWLVAGNWSMVAMYAAWTANCVYGWVNWTGMEEISRRKGVLILDKYCDLDADVDIQELEKAEKEAKEILKNAPYEVVKITKDEDGVIVSCRTCQTRKKKS